MNKIEKNWILEELRPFQLNAEVSPIQRNICFIKIGGTLGGYWDDITGGTEAAIDELDEGAWLDNLTGVVDDTGVLDVAVDLLDDGQVDDTFGGVVEEVVGSVGLGDPTTPLVTYSKTGQLTEITQVQSVPVIYGTRKIRGIKVYKELWASTGGVGWDAEQDWYVIYVLSEGEIEGLSGVICNKEFSSLSSTISGSEYFDISYSLVNGEDGGGINPWSGIMAYRDLSWERHREGNFENILENLGAIYIKLSASQELIKAGRKDTSLPRFSFIVKGKKIRTSTSSDDLHFSSNPVWCLRDYLTNSIYGVGLADSLLDDASFTASALICEPEVTNESGVHTHGCNMIVDTAQPLMENVKRILKTCNGSLLWVSGKYHIKIATTLVGDPAMTFDVIH